MKAGRWYALYLVCCVATVSAQEPVFLHYTTDDKLPGNMVYDIYRDTEGFLWFGTDNGVARYNGIEFEAYSTADGLPDNDIFYFKEDYHKRMWVSTYNGELSYYENGRFYNAGSKEFLKLPFTPSDIKFIALHQDSSLSFSFMNQPHHFVNIKENDLRIIDVKYQEEVLILNIIKFRSGNYQLVTHESKVLIDSNGNVLEVKRHKDNEEYLASYGHDSVYLFNDNGIYNRYGDLAYRFTGKNDRIIRIFFWNKLPFIGTDKGLIIGDKTYLENEKISSITRDINGNFWIGTLGNGVFKLKSNYGQYSYYKNIYEGKATCSYNTRDGLLFGTSANKFYKIINGVPLFISGTNAKSLTGKQYIDSTFFYSFTGDKLFAVSHTGDKRIQKSINCLTGSSLKTIIVNDSIGYFQYTSDIYSANYRMAGSPEHHLFQSDTRIFHMDGDVNGNVWYTTKKMYKIVDKLPVHQKQFDELSLKWFKFFNGIFIGVTQNSRLIVSNGPSDTRLAYTSIKDTCIWNNAYQIDDDHLLFSTDGLYRLMTVYPSTGDSISYSMTVLANDFLPRDVEHVASDGKQVFFFKDGVVFTVAAKELFSVAKPPVIADVVFQTGKGYYNTHRPVNITHAEAENIRLSINALSFDSKSPVYQYSISKDDENAWNTVRTKDLNISAIGYGGYKIKVRAVIPSGIPGETYVVAVNILKPFYLQWWFLISGIIVVAAMVFIGFRLRIHYLLDKREREHAMKMRIVKSEYTALNALMNPHFIFNSLNSIQSFINKSNKASANLYLDLLSRLMRQNMHNVSKDVIPLNEEIELVRNYLQLEKMRFNDRFEYTIEVQEDIDDTDIFIPPLLIQPLAENALKHGLLARNAGDNKLWIRVGLRQSKLVIELEDNGVGFQAGAVSVGRKDGHKSYALSNIYARISQLNELHGDAIRLDIFSGNKNTGTRIEIVMDVDKLATPVNYRS